MWEWNLNLIPGDTMGPELHSFIPGSLASCNSVSRSLWGSSLTDPGKETLPLPIPAFSRLYDSSKRLPSYHGALVLPAPAHPGWRLPPGGLRVSQTSLVDVVTRGRAGAGVSGLFPRHGSAVLLTVWTHFSREPARPLRSSYSLRKD